MAVTIDEEVDVWMRLQVFLRVEHQMLAVLTHVGWFLAVGTLQTRVFGPMSSELHAPPRVHEVEQALAGAVVEHPAQELELAVGVAESVAMCQVEHLTIDIGGQRLAMQDDAAFLFEVSVGPDVVVTREVMNLDTHIGEFRQLSKETCIALGHHMSVLVPEVEHVAQQIDGSRLLLDAVEESYQSALLHALMLYGKRAQMGVGQEIDILHIYS